MEPILPYVVVSNASRSRDLIVQGANVIERAFQLAGESGSVDEVKRKLIREGYLSVHAHLGGRQIRTDILKRLDPKLVAYRKSSAA